MAQSPDVTGLLVAWSNGEEAASGRLVDAVYGEIAPPGPGLPAA